MGRQATLTKLGPKKLSVVRGRGGNLKYRALSLEQGNFTWQTEQCTRKTRIIDTVYNATNNEFSRTKTLLKNSVVSIDCTPFKTWYATHYGETLGNVKDEAEKICGVPAAVQFEEEIVAVVKWVDGTVIDCVRKVR